MRYLTVTAQLLANEVLRRILDGARVCGLDLRGRPEIREHVLAPCPAAAALAVDPVSQVAVALRIDRADDGRVDIRIWASAERVAHCWFSLDKEHFGISFDDLSERYLVPAAAALLNQLVPKIEIHPDEWVGAC